LIFFPGALTARSEQSAGDWDNSVLQRPHDCLRQSASSWQSAAHLLTDASQAVLKIDHLSEIIATGGEARLRARMEIMDMARSVCRAILVDAEREEFTRVATSFSGLPEMLDRFMMRDAAAAEMPVALLYGRSAAGLNATGESDTRGWYDVVEDAQNDVLRPRLERVVRVFMLAKSGPTHGQEPENWKLKFNSLWQPTGKHGRISPRLISAPSAPPLPRTPRRFRRRTTTSWCLKTASRPWDRPWATSLRCLQRDRTPTASQVPLLAAVRSWLSRRSILAPSQGWARPAPGQ